MTFDYHTYLSPFTWRYGSEAMRHIWSEIHKRQLWREIWVAVAQVQAEYGLVSSAQLQELHDHKLDVDISRSLQIEAEIHHDLMAELKAFAEQCPSGGAILHLGATSMDIEDNADVLRLRESIDIILEKLSKLLLSLTDQIEQWAKTPIMAFTHLQPAEPSTLGYRLAQYAQDLLSDWEDLRRVRRRLRGKGFKGAVGTGASYAELLGDESQPEFEARLSTRLGLPFYLVSTQTYPRKQDYQVISALAGLGGSLYKFAFDLRILQSPPVGEWSEPFGKKQVGSSAMPFKRNPINSEKINSLARSLAQMPRLAWDNAAHSLLERTLDDSANRRTMLPEAFLIADELLLVAERILSGLTVYPTRLQRTLQIYGPFAATERILMALGKRGANRQEMHERLRQHAMLAWQAVQDDQENPLIELVVQDAVLQNYLPVDELRRLMDASGYTGSAEQRAYEMASLVREALGV